MSAETRSGSHAVKISRQRRMAHNIGKCLSEQAEYHTIMPSAPRLHAHHCTEAIADVLGDEVILAKPVASFNIGGCQFSEPAWETNGKQVEIVLSFPKQHIHIPLQGIVALDSTKTMEVRFTNLSQEQRWALEKAIRKDQESNKRR